RRPRALVAVTARAVAVPLHFSSTETARTELYTLSLHDALPIWTLIAEDGVLRPRTREALGRVRETGTHVVVVTGRMFRAVTTTTDRKSTRLNSSHRTISYAVFCLKKKKKKKTVITPPCGITMPI